MKYRHLWYFDLPENFRAKEPAADDKHAAQFRIMEKTRCAPLQKAYRKLLFEEIKKYDVPDAEHIEALGTPEYLVIQTNHEIQPPLSLNAQKYFSKVSVNHEMPEGI